MEIKYIFNVWCGISTRIYNNNCHNPFLGYFAKSKQNKIKITKIKGAGVGREMNVKIFGVFESPIIPLLC